MAGLVDAVGDVGGVRVRRLARQQQLPFARLLDETRRVKRVLWRNS
jgi:hypothetical protein